jgi:hypothetical protein
VLAGTALAVRRIERGTIATADYLFIVLDHFAAIRHTPVQLAPPIVASDQHPRLHARQAEWNRLHPYTSLRCP